MAKLYYSLSLLLFLTFSIQAQYNYDTLWARVENLELQGKIRSASRQIGHISNIAKKRKQPTSIN